MSWREVEARCAALLLPGLSLRSRIHALRTSPTPLLIKRDDELGGFPLSGSKVRKYAALIPALARANVRRIAVLGSPASNNLVGLVSMLLQNDIRPVVCYRRSTLRPSPSVNARLLAGLVSESDCWTVDDLASPAVIGQQLSDRLKEPIQVLSEGASHPSAFPGALTLAFDICHHLDAGELDPQAPIFFDCGTGFSAAVVCAAAGHFGWENPIVVVCMSGEPTMHNSLEVARAEFQALLNLSAPPPSPKNMTICSPRAGRSFGSLHSGVANFMREFTKANGVWLDPLYSGKLFHTAFSMLRDTKHTGPRPLVVHSGGTHTLLGYDRLLPPQHHIVRAL